MAEIASARRRRGAVRGSLTRIEKDIAKMEAKETLGPSGKRRKEEDQDAMETEEKVYMMHAHGSHVMEIIDRLE